jgi:hypothetical protein
VDQPVSPYEMCLEALEKYIREARKTCELINEAQSETLSMEQLFMILVQTRIESQFKESYDLARERLCEALMSQTTAGQYSCPRLSVSTYLSSPKS